MNTTIKSNYYGDGKSAIISTLNEQPLYSDMENFRPIDFLVGGYGTCMMSIMDKIGIENGFRISKAKTEISYEMLTDNSRIDTLEIKCFIEDAHFTFEQKQILEQTALNKCPIGNSLHSDIKRRYEFIYGKY
ncbi:OsmC family protein [Myroides odoratimimus]|uniref:OsmC family protein n=1 Tax=Myroides odoratimimus TaxID=76832 RepID=UPI003100C939